MSIRLHRTEQTEPTESDPGVFMAEELWKNVKDGVTRVSQLLENFGVWISVHIKLDKSKIIESSCHTYDQSPTLRNSSS